MPISPEDSDGNEKIKSKQFHLQDNEIQVENLSSESDKIQSVQEFEVSDELNHFDDFKGPVQNPSGYSQSVLDAGDQNEDIEQMVEDIIRWTELNKIFDPLFRERRFDIKMVDKSTQHTTLCKQKKIETLKLMLAPRPKVVVGKDGKPMSTQEKLKSSMLLNTTTADIMKAELESKLLNKEVKQFKDTLGLKKDINDNVIFDKQKRSKLIYAQNIKLLSTAIDK